MGNCFFAKYMANDDPRRADSENPIFIFFFRRILDPGHLRGPGVKLGSILGGPLMGVQPEGCMDPPFPPAAAATKSPPNPCVLL